MNVLTPVNFHSIVVFTSVLSSLRLMIPRDASAHGYTDIGVLIFPLLQMWVAEGRGVREGINNKRLSEGVLFSFITQTL